MSVTVDYRKEIVNLSRELPDGELRALIDFAQFLKAKKEGFTYMQVGDGAEYVRKLRTREGKRAKSGKNFIEELIQWQKSNS
ncbi:MAG: hypothetical protein MUP27_07290 [Desulfobacterales bacterium]|jgi:hypothetical protein|nr:hypothetical protein [Desulfobacterales bacterium]